MEVKKMSRVFVSTVANALILSAAMLSWPSAATAADNPGGLKQFIKGVVEARTFDLSRYGMKTRPSHPSTRLLR